MAKSYFTEESGQHKGSIVLGMLKDEAVEFANWIAENKIIRAFDKDGKWFVPYRGHYTTDELYDLYSDTKAKH